MLKLKWQEVAVLGLAAVLLCGCKRGETTPPKAQEDAPAQSSNSQSGDEVLFKAQRDALNKAKAVEGQLQQQAQDQEKSIEAAQK